MAAGLDLSGKVHVNHIDRDPSNNRLSNLEVVTPGQNRRHGYLTRIRTGKSNLTWKQVQAIRREYQTGVITKRRLAELCGVTPPTIDAIVTGRTWQYEDYHQAA